MRTIVVGYDGEQAAERALDRAIEEARGSGARLVVVAVLALPLNPEGPQNFGTLDDSPARMIPLVVPPELEPVQQHAAERISAEGIEAELFWAVGDPAQEIVDAAREHKASVVIVGSHHHSLLGRLLRLDVAAEAERELDAKVIAVD